jgi:hypothetical protein
MEEQNKNQEPTSKNQPQGCFQGVTLIASVVMIIVAFGALFQTCS